MVSKVSSRPPLKKVVDTDLEKQFIQQGDIVQNKKARDLLPWEKEHVRDDVIKIFNIRLPETLFLKLEYLSCQTRRSKHSICYEAVEKAVDDILNDIIPHDSFT